ncbi:CBM96 family carbohydrate-binding protein [Pedobacter cryophilus]|nr:DNRLRE domain-containing protein [Pedobacter cryophilus]
MKLVYRSIIVAAFLLLNMSCGKLELLKNAQLEAVNAGKDLKNMTISDFLSVDHSNDLTKLSLYAEAIKHAGLMEFFDQPGDYTLLFLSDQAVTIMVNSLGYKTISDIPPVVLKNILSDNIFKGRLHSFDLALNETKKFETINGSFIYFTRSNTSSDEYVLTANKSSDLSSPSAIIRTQNLEFSNGIAHVTDQFTFYKLIDAVPDAPSGTVGEKTDTSYVSKDLFIQNGTANRDKNFNNTTSIDMKNSNGKDVSVDRMGLFQFPLQVPSFGNKIGLAKLNFYVYFTGIASTLSVYKGSDVDFNEALVTFTTAPTYDRVSIGNTSLKASFSGWVSVDVTSTVNQLYGNSKSFINVLMNHNTDNFVKIYPREFSSGKYKSYLTITSPPKSILTIINLNTVNANGVTGITVLNGNQLKMGGTDDKNITYNITKIPSNGFLVKYGIPLSLNSSFSQTDLDKGAIKYLYAGTGTADELELEAKDQNGGYYAGSLKLNFNIQ